MMTDIDSPNTISSGVKVDKVLAYKVKLFASAKQALGIDHCVVEVSLPISVGDFMCELAKQFPALRQFVGYCRLAVDCRFVSEEDIIPDMIHGPVEIALIPPVSGG